MPVHEYVCEACGKSQEQFRHPTQELLREIRCTCGEPARLVPSIFNVDGIPMNPHYNAGLGKMVKNTKDLRTDRNGRPVEYVGRENGG